MSDQRRTGYFTPSPRFWPQFIVEQTHDVWSLYAFIQNEQPDLLGGRIEGSNQYLISGPAAELLHLCLAGHRYGSPASFASVELARAARAQLQAIAPTPGGYWLAHRLVQHWGEEIWPAMTRPRKERQL